MAGGDLQLPSGGADFSVPGISSLAPDISGDASLPSISGDLPSPGLDVAAGVPMASVNVDAPPVEVSMPFVKGDISGSLPVIIGDVSAPSVDVDLLSGSAGVGMPSVDMAGKVPYIPSGGVEVPVEQPSADVMLTAPDVDVKHGAASLTAGLAAGTMTGIGAIGAGIGLMGKSDQPEVEVRVPRGIKKRKLKKVLFLL